MLRIEMCRHGKREGIQISSMRLDDSTRPKRKYYLRDGHMRTGTFIFCVVLSTHQPRLPHRRVVYGTLNFVIRIERKASCILSAEICKLRLAPPINEMFSQTPDVVAADKPPTQTLREASISFKFHVNLGSTLFFLPCFFLNELSIRDFFFVFLSFLRSSPSAFVSLLLLRQE